MPNNHQLYFAGPLFSEAEKQFNARLCKRLESELGLKAFLPQRDGFESTTLDGLSEKEKFDKIFEFDRDKVLAASIFVCVLDGPVPDDGTAVELGIASTQKYLDKAHKDKIIVGLLTDMRTFGEGQRLNSMLGGALDYLATSEDELIDYLKKAKAGL